MDQGEKATRKQYWSWALYDWANSAFATTVMAGFFPVFFKAYWAGEASVQTSTLYLGTANSISSAVLMILAPVLGAIADRGSAKKKLLVFFAYIGILMTGALWFVAQGNWQFAALLFIGGNIGFAGANIFYDSLLVAVASERKRDFVSSLGYALGYIGGGVLFLLNVLMYQMPAAFGIPDGATAIRISFVTVAVWWALFTIPLMLFVKEPAEGGGLGFVKAVREGFKQIAETAKRIKHLKVVGLFLVAYWFMIDGVDTIIKMAVDYGSSLGFPSSSLIVALLIVQFVAFPAALLYNLLAKKIGVKNALLIAIGAYTVITIIAYFMTSVTMFYVLAITVGLFQGGIQALSRSCYSRLIPEKQAGEFYGFFNMFGKFATIIGPLLMGLVTQLTGSNRLGILSIIVLFVAGGVLLLRVDLKRGEEEARSYPG